MTKLYGVYGVVIMLTFGYASYQGYAFSSLFSTQQHSGSAKNHSYHK